MSLNEQGFIKDFTGYVKKLGVKRILEVGALTGELMEAVGGDGIDLNPSRSDVKKADIRNFKTRKKYEMIFSSGLLEHYSEHEAIEVLAAMANKSTKYVLSFVPNSNCVSYMNAKRFRSARWPEEWRKEDDYSVEKLAKLHEKIGLKVIDKGVMGEGWAKLFGKEESEGYLVYCLAEKAIN